MRNQLAGSLRAVLAQRLLPDLQGGRVALYELLVNTPAAANLIREGKRGSCPGLFKPVSRRGCRTLTRAGSDGRRGGCRPRRSVTLFEIAFEDNDGRSRIDAAFVECAETPCSNRPARASTVLNRSSWSFTETPKRPWILLANLRARAVSGCSVPSMFSGRPTITSSGCHSLSRRSMRFQSGVPSFALRAVSGRAVPVIRWPTATPMLSCQSRRPEVCRSLRVPATPGMVRISMPISFAASRQRSAIGF